MTIDWEVLHTWILPFILFLPRFYIPTYLPTIPHSLSCLYILSYTILLYGTYTYILLPFHYMHFPYFLEEGRTLYLPPPHTIILCRHFGFSSVSSYCGLPRITCGLLFCHAPYFPATPLPACYYLPAAAYLIPGCAACLGSFVPVLPPCRWRCRSLFIPGTEQCATAAQPFVTSTCTATPFSRTCTTCTPAHYLPAVIYLLCAFSFPVSANTGLRFYAARRFR